MSSVEVAVGGDGHQPCVEGLPGQVRFVEHAAGAAGDRFDGVGFVEGVAVAEQQVPGAGGQDPQPWRAGGLAGYRHRGVGSVTQPVPGR